MGRTGHTGSIEENISMSNMLKEIKRRLKYGQGARAYLKKQPSNCEKEPSVITENEKSLNPN